MHSQYVLDKAAVKCCMKHGYEVAVAIRPRHWHSQAQKCP